METVKECYQYSQKSKYDLDIKKLPYLKKWVLISKTLLELENHQNLALDNHNPQNKLKIKIILSRTFKKITSNPQSFKHTIIIGTHEHKLLILYSKSTSPPPHNHHETL